LTEERLTEKVRAASLLVGFALGHASPKGFDDFLPEVF
jgi:hypothetical protein